jgi:hypothetical protein
VWVIKLRDAMAENINVIKLTNCNFSPRVHACLSPQMISQKKKSRGIPGREVFLEALRSCLMYDSRSGHGPCNKKLSVRLSESITLFRLFLFFITPRIARAFFFLFKSRSYQSFYSFFGPRRYSKGRARERREIWSWLFIVLWRSAAPAEKNWKRDIQWTRSSLTSARGFESEEMTIRNHAQNGQTMRVSVFVSESRLSRNSRTAAAPLSHDTVKDQNIFSCKRILWKIYYSTLLELNRIAAWISRARESFEIYPPVSFNLILIYSSDECNAYNEDWGWLWVSGCCCSGGN